MAKKSSKKPKHHGGGIQDLGQQLISGAQERAEDAAKRVQKSVQEALGLAEKRYNLELKNLQGRLRDLNTNMGGLERSYRALERRVTRQIETLSGRAVKASDLDRRTRPLEADIRRAAGLGSTTVASASRATTSRTRRARKRVGRRVAKTATTV